MDFNLHEVKSFDESSHGSSWSSLLEPSSSSLSSSFGSELGSTGTESEKDEDSEFMAELTRQMANYMLEDDNDVDNNNNGDGTSVYYCDQRFIDSCVQPSCMKSIEVYQLKNQPSVKVDMTESTHRFNQGKGRVSSQNRSGMMRAVFLGGSRSGYGSCGTGVFLPRVIDDNNQTTHPKEKSGCSTVLIPEKVLQALQLHFSNTDASAYHSRQGKSKQKRSSEFKSKQARKNQEKLLLPEEWTY